MESVCQHCGESAFNNEDQVCEKCGFFIDEPQLDSGFNPFTSDTKPKLHLWPKKQNSAGLSFGMDQLNVLCLKYSISSEVKAFIFDLLTEVYSTMSFARKQDVGVMAGCCLIHVQGEQNQFISLTDLCSKLQCSKKKAFKFSKVLKLHLSKRNKNKVTGIKSEEPEFNNMDFGKKLESSIRTLLASVSVEKKEQLVHKTTALTKLANSCWLISGRSPEGVIVASAYLCWKSMDPSRKALSFKHFCSDFSLPYSKARPRVSELREMLLKLGRKIPSFTKNYVHEKNVLFHLDYILNNSETLRNDLLSEECNTEDIDKKEFFAFRRSYPVACKSMKSESAIKSETKTVYKDDMCASDIEISDTEISSYIRTDEQVEMIKSLRGEEP